MAFVPKTKHSATFLGKVKHFLAYFLATESSLYITTEDGKKLIVGEDNSFYNKAKNV